MSEPFDNGTLPTPETAPSPDPDQVVVTLAEQIAARDANSTPALMTGLQMAGFGIRALDRSLMVKPGTPSQGMAFDAWQVAAMAKLYDEHWRISLADLSAILIKGLPELQKVDLNHVLVDGINASAEGTQPLRFWSRLIIELGRNADQPYDLSTEKVDLEAVQLDSIQVALILQRFWGDLSVVKEHHSLNAESTAYEPMPFANPRFETAVYHSNRRARLLLIDSGSPGPCELQEPLDLILDINAILQTTEWKNLINLEKQLEAMEEAANLKARINIVSILLKFYLTYAGLHADIRMDPSILIRNKDTSAGRDASLTAHVSYQLDKWGLNCLLAALRPWLNLLGLDAGNLPNNGDVPGVGVTWILVDGGVNTAIIPRDQASVDAYNATAIVEFNPGGGSEGLHTLVNQVTAKHGVATLPVFGAPRRHDLSVFKLVPVKKSFSVAIEVKFKGADPEKFLGELADTLGPALGVASGDVLSGAVAALTEMLYRMSWHVGETYPFPVQDWQMCEGGWGGTIDVVTTEQGVVNSSGDGWINTDAMKIVQSAEVELHGSPDHGPAWEGLSQGAYSARLEGSRTGISRGRGATCTVRDKSTASGSGEVQYAVTYAGENALNVSPAATATFMSGEVSKTNSCSDAAQDNGNHSINAPVEFPAFRAPLSPSTPGASNGTLTLVQGPPATQTVTWNLTQCAR